MRLAWIVGGSLVTLLVLLGFALTRQLKAVARLHYRPGDQDMTFAFAPDGKALVFSGVGEGGRDLYLLDLATQRVTRLTHSPDYELSPSFSLDGRWIVYAAGKPNERADHLFLSKRDGSERRQLTFEDANDAHPLFYNTENRILFMRSHRYYTGGMVQWGTWGEDELRFLTTTDRATEGIRSVEWNRAPLALTASSDVLFSHDDGITELSLDTGKAGEWTLPLQRGEALQAFAFAPKEQRLAYVTSLWKEGYALYLRERTGAIRSLVKKPYLFAPVFTPNGKEIYFLTARYEERIPKIDGLWRVDLDGKNLRQVADETLFRAPMTWRPSRAMGD